MVKSLYRQAVNCRAQLFFNERLLNMKKTVCVISARPGMAEFYAGILRNLCSDFMEIHLCSLEDGSIRSMPQCDLYVSSVTSYDLLRNNWARDFLPAMSTVVPMDVSFSKAALDLLHTYPEGTKALLVNQNKHMTMECIAQLYHLGISNIEFYPCYPGAEKLPETDLVFTVGEPDLVPEDAVHVVDIGSRWPSVNTLTEIALKLGNAFFLESERFRRYQARLAGVDYSLLKITSDTLSAENKLEMILNSLDEGIVCINEQGLITLINRCARELLGVNRSEVLNRKVTRALPMLPFDRLRPEGTGSVGPLLINVRDTDLGVTLSPLLIQEQYLGAFAQLHRFRESEDQQIALRKQKTRRSHKAKYFFKDIIGTSPEISRARDIARRMAPNDAAVLLEGEAGTGKAMFAQAIHNASPRANGAFVTLNCAALRDDLLEVELFGYAKGSLESAEGRTGLVEIAHRGTLFLDSLESMSPRLQASLLRMLQAREITRLGSDEPVPIDVRIISSTSIDLQKRVREGTFRRDLYYRLNVIAIRVPTLWERRTDVPLLVDHFRASMDARFELTSQARVALLQHRWEGNVRELKNCIEYLKYTGLQTIDFDDLPDVVREPRTRSMLREDLERRSGLKIREYWVMRELGEVYGDQSGLGRQAIAERCLSHGNAITEHEVREALKALSEMGLAKVRTGRGGTALTEKGYLRYRRIVHDEESLT